MAKKIPSKVNIPFWALKGFLGGGIVSIILRAWGIMGEWVGLETMLGFIVLPWLMGQLEANYPKRKLRAWCTYLSRDGIIQAENTGERIEFLDESGSLPIRWSLPAHLKLGASSEGSMAWIAPEGDHRLPDDLLIDAVEDDPHERAFYVDGPEAYLAACMTPEMHHTLSTLFARYSMSVREGRLYFDMRYTPRRDISQPKLTEDLEPFVTLINQLTIPKPEIPGRIWSGYQATLAYLEAGPSTGVEHDSIQERADHMLSVFIRYHGHTQFVQEKIQVVMDSDRSRDRLITATEVLLRSARREPMPTMLVDQAVAFMESVLQEDGRHDGPFGPALRGLLGHLGPTRGQWHLTECLQMVGRFQDEVGVISALFEACAEWSQWPEPALIQKILTGDLLVGTGGQDIVKSLKIYFEQTPDQAVFDQIAMTCIDSMPPLSVPRSLESFEAHLELLTWVGSTGSLALAGPLATLAESLPRLPLTLATEDASFLSRLALEAKRSRSALVERHGDGGGRLSILNEATHAGGGVSLSKDAESSTESS